MPIYYPSARARLILRFEDYGARTTPPVPSVLQTKRRGLFKAEEPAKLQVIEEAGGALRIAGPGDVANQQGTPQQQTASADELTHVVDGITPLGASFARNGIRTANTLNLTFAYLDLPIDPRVVRSCAVEFFLGTVTAEEFERGQSGETRFEGEFAIPTHLVPGTYIDDQGRVRTNRRFQGWADDWEIDFPPDGEATLSLTCTSNTRLLIDQPHPTKMSVATDRPIDQAIAEYLANFPFARGLSVEYRPRGPGVEIPVLGSVLTKQAFPPGLGPPAAKDGSANLKVWDYLTDIATSVGHTVRVIDTTVVIQRASTLYDVRYEGRSDDPFRGRQLPDGRFTDKRTMIYGRNIESLRGKRGLTKYAPKNVEVRCFNPARKRTLVARYPSLVRQQKALLPGETADAKYVVKTVEGIGDERTLLQIAQSVYEAQQRRELEFTLETRELTSLGGDNQLDPDILDADAGDAIVIDFSLADESEGQLDADGARTTISEFERELRTRPREFLLQLGFPDEFATAYQQALSTIAFQTVFRVREIQYDWDSQSEGIKLTIYAMNFIEARADDGLEDDPSLAQEQPQQIFVRDNR